MLSYLRLAFWTIFWLVVWPLVLPFKKRGQHNCVTWAMDEWDKDDGYIVIRWCRSSKFRWLRWPHFLYLDKENNEQLRHLLPTDDSKLTKRVVPDMWFTGKERVGDPQDFKGEN